MSQTTKDYNTLRNILLSNGFIPVIIEYDNYISVDVDVHGTHFTRNIIKHDPPSGEHAALLSDHWQTVISDRTENGSRTIGDGSNQTKVDRVSLVGVAAQPKETKTISNVTTTTISFSGSPLVSSTLTADTSVGAYTVQVTDTTGFYVGMRVIIDETGKPSKQTHVESIVSSTMIKLMSSIDQVYTTAGGAVLRQSLRGRECYVNSDEILDRFNVISDTTTSVTLATKGKDLTTITSIGKSMVFTEEIITIKQALGGANDDVAFLFEARNNSLFGDSDEHDILLTYGKGTPMIEFKIILRGDDIDYLICRIWDYKSKIPDVSMFIGMEVRQ